MGSYRPHMEQDQRKKRFVEVVADFSPDGELKPLEIVWDTGVRYHIDKVLEARQAHSLKTGGTGIRYKVRIGAATTHLWFDGRRWFVEAKRVAMPEDW